MQCARRVSLSRSAQWRTQLAVTLAPVTILIMHAEQNSKAVGGTIEIFTFTLIGVLRMSFASSNTSVTGSITS